MLERFGAFVRCFLLAAEHHDHAALGVELDDHVRTFVRNPDVVFGIDFDRMAEGPRVEVVADLADELAVGTEFEQLRCGGPVGGPVVLPRDKAKTCPLELTATPAISPR